MSFIYACKLKETNLIDETIKIYSDTKIIFNEIEEKSFDVKTLNNIKSMAL